jgi:hypothetical protein
MQLLNNAEENISMKYDLYLLQTQHWIKSFAAAA